MTLLSPVGPDFALWLDRARRLIEVPDERDWITNRAVLVDDYAFLVELFHDEPAVA